jgi:N4-(beta-N-acetylglucosaminyl)-L-asparaginase
MRRHGRRSFLLRSSALMGSTGCLASRRTAASARAPGGAVKPVAVSSTNGHGAPMELILERLMAGDVPVDAAVAGVNLVENDPTDHSVGYGGLPNERGVVELDAAVMDGKTGLSGAVASIRNIKNPSKVAVAVMRYTDHALLTGNGALEFARAHGFKEEELLTDEARQIWLYWKSTLSDTDDWLPRDPKLLPPDAKKMFGITGTIHCSLVAPDGTLGAVTTTSGLAFKIPGRVGDSPIVGAGLFLDNDVGSAGSTGRGEANIITSASAMIVEAMRGGKHPKDACLAMCQRVANTTRVKRLLRPDGKPDFNVSYYAVDKSGQWGGAQLWSGGQYAVGDANGSRLEDLAYLFEVKA